MENETKEETQETVAEEETTETEEETQEVEETSSDEEVTSQKKEYTDSEKRLYARAKRAEEATKKAKAELVESQKPTSEIDAILEVQQATKGLDMAEVAELKLRATANRTSLVDARQNDDFQLWQKAYKEKVAKENIPDPSTKQSKTGSKNLDDLTEEETEKLFVKQGWVKNYGRPPRQEKFSE